MFLLLVQASGVLAAGMPATLEWGRRVALGTPLDGVVAEVPVRKGQRVKEGALLVRLDDRLARARVRQAEAALAQARQDRDEARRELQRALDLYERTLSSKHERQQAEIAAAAGEAAFARARLALTVARLELEYSRVRAPFDGVVVELAAQAGETVVNRLRARPLVVLAQSGPLRARLRVTAAQARRWPEGHGATVVWGGARYPGRMLAAGLEPVAQGETGPLYPLDVLFEAPPERLPRRGEPLEVIPDE